LRHRDIDFSTPHTRMRRRRRFDDEPPVHRGQKPAPPADLDGRGGTDPDGPPAGDRWSTWTGALHGPTPRPRWVVVEHAAVDTELGILKSGKEADVHLLERAVPGSTRRVLLAAKRYRTAEHRLVPPRRRLPRGPAGAPVPGDAGDGEPHGVRPRPAVGPVGRSRVRRAGGAVGRRSGRPLPGPAGGTELLLEFIGAQDTDEAAPRLAQLRPEPDLVARLWHQLVEALRGLARHGLTHGDLSAYNLLVHDGRLVMIDLPQVVDVVGNPQGPQFLARDVKRIAGWFTARGISPAAADALHEVVRANLLLPPGP
jgi:RIO kinase 1